MCIFMCPLHVHKSDRLVKCLSFFFVRILINYINILPLYFNLNYLFILVVLDIRKLNIYYQRILIYHIAHTHTHTHRHIHTRTHMHTHMQHEVEISSQ